MDAGKKKIWVRGQFVEVTDEVYTAYMRGDRKMRYFEADLKSERPVYGSNGEIKQVLPSREDSLDRLMEENARQFAAAAESVEDVVIRKLVVDKLHTALIQLTKEERDFICALFFDEKTESEVAKGRLWPLLTAEFEPSYDIYLLARTDPARDTATQLFWDEVYRRVRALRKP